MCNFPAQYLLDRRRDLAKNFPDVEPLKANTMREIGAIDELRWRHFEETGCDCWDKIREAK